MDTEKTQCADTTDSIQSGPYQFWYLTECEIYMEAAAINRKLKELDALEKRLRQTVNPSQVLLLQIKKEREELLNPKEQK